MNANDDLERRIANYYASEAPGRAPDWVLGAVISTIDTTPQRRVPFGVPWTIPDVQSRARFVLGGAVAIVIAIAALTALRPVAAPGPGNDRSPSLTPAPTVTPLPALTQTFTSDIHGMSVSYAADWVVVQARQPWTSGVPFQDSDFADLLDPVGANAFILGASQPLLGRNPDDWIEAMTGHPAWGDSCPATTRPVTIDGATGVLVTHCPDNDTRSSLVSAGGRGYVFVAYGLDPQLFDEILASIELQPDAAVDPSEAPSIGD